MEEPMPTCLISPRFASALILHGPATARDLAHYLSLIAPLTASKDELTHHELIFGADASVRGASTMGRLLSDMGAATFANLTPSQDRLRHTRVAFHFETPSQRQWHRTFIDMESSGYGVRRNQEVGYQVGRKPVAVALAGGRGLAVDLEALRAMNSGDTAVMYLRALAWMRGGLRQRDAWGYHSGALDTTLRIPIADIPDALGFVEDAGDPRALQASRITERVLKPARAALARAGIRLQPHWIAAEGYSRICSHLHLTLTRIASDQIPTEAKRRGRPRKVALTAA
jgi:hypothetical protein